MGLEQTVGVAYGVSFVSTDIYPFMVKLGMFVNVVKPEAIVDVAKFAEFPQEALENHYLVLKDVFPNVEFDFWFDQDEGYPVLFSYVSGSHKGVSEKHESRLPVKLGGNEYSGALDKLLSSTGYEKTLEPDWVFYAYVF